MKTPGRNLVSESTIRELVAAGKKSLAVSRDTIITPLAAEMAKVERISLVTSQDSGTDSRPTDQTAALAVATATSQPIESKVVAFGSDHGGYQLKEQLKKHAESLGYKILDVGTNSEEACDYPDYAYAVALAVMEGRAWRGVMIDGAGIGSAVVANKVPGVRAACCHNEFVARNAREHNDTNVLTLGSRVVGSEVCKEILSIWLKSVFAGGRHGQRVNKIIDVEKKYLK
jgi:ribose 5-phosphate isomerase B